MFVREGGECRVVGIHSGSKGSEKIGRFIDEEVLAQVGKWRSQLNSLAGFEQTQQTV